MDREDYGDPSMMSLPTYMGSFPAPGSYAPGSFFMPHSSYPYAGDSMPTSMYGGPTDQETDDRPTEVEEDPTEPPATVDLTGKAMFIGLLSGCTVGADLDGDGKVSGDEPTDTTDDFGGWTLTVDEDEVDPDGVDGPVVHVMAGTKCVDRSTGSSLRVPLKAAQGCGIVSLFSTLQLELFEEAQEASTTELEDVTALAMANAAIAKGVGGPAAASLDICSFEPMEEVWDEDGDDDLAASYLKSTVEIGTVVTSLTEIVAGEKNQKAFGETATAVMDKVAEIQLKNADDASKAEGFATGTRTRSSSW